MSDNLAYQKAQLQGHQFSLNKLEDHIVQLSKNFDKVKKQLSTKKRSVEAAVTRELTPKQSISIEQLQKFSLPL